MTIEAIMSRPVATLSPSATCAEAARRMRRENVGSVVIEDDGVPIGMVTDRDLALRVIAEELDAGSVTVAQVMSAFPAFPAFLTPRRDVRAALDAMLDMGVRRLPAVNAKGRVIGIVSLDDILIELADELGMVRRLLQLERGHTDPDDLPVD
jgi:CBS domain-containing protein